MCAGVESGAAGVGRVVALSVLDGRELLVAAGLEDEWAVGEWEGVEEEEFEFDGVGRVGLDEFALFVDVGDFLVGDVGCEAGVSGGDVADEVSGDDVHGGAAGAEGELAVGVFPLEEVVGHVGVLDDDELAVEEAEVSELLQGVALDESARGHVGAGEVMESDEERVHGLDEWVVDLPVGEDGDAAALHVVEGSGVEECGEGAAVSVGGEGEGVPVGEEGVSVGVDGGEGALREEHDVLGVESEVVVVGEELASGLVIDFGGHDVPGDDAAVLLLVAEDAFGEELEEALVLEFGDGVGALGGVVAESCSLSAGDGEAGDLSGLEEFDAVGGGLLEASALVVG